MIKIRQVGRNIKYRYNKKQNKHQKYIQMHNLKINKIKEVQ